MVMRSTAKLGVIVGTTPPILIRSALSMWARTRALSQRSSVPAAASDPAALRCRPPYQIDPRWAPCWDACRQGGDIFHDLAPHDVDFVCFSLGLGEPSEVRQERVSSCDGKEREMVDTVETVVVAAARSSSTRGA